MIYRFTGQEYGKTQQPSSGRECNLRARTGWRFHKNTGSDYGN